MKDAEIGVSKEFVRASVDGVDKFDRRMAQLGALHAKQDVRAIKRLHTWYPGQRCELDYTKYALWLYPNGNWSEPLLYYTGHGVDHASGVIKGFAVTTAPAARDAIRLYRRCVLPKSLWLPPEQRDLAQRWDVFGIDLLVAIDNATDFVANGVILMFMGLGVIVLRMPPNRGDLKGTVERTQSSMESKYVSRLDGYVPLASAGLNPRYTKSRERAKAAAKYTVEEYERMYAQYCIEYNHARHPRLKEPRIAAYRNGLELAPPILLTNPTQIRLTFALTYEAKLTREGVEVETFKYNGKTLGEMYRVYSGRVFVKLDPDDVRTVLVVHPQWSEPVEAYLTTFKLSNRVSLELLRVLLARIEATGVAPDASQETLAYVFDEVYQNLLNAPASRTPGAAIHSDAQAAAHAASAPHPSAIITPAAHPLDLRELLGGDDLDE